MKYILGTLALCLTMSTFANEEVIADNVKLKSADADPYGQLCVAALKSDEHLHQRARELDVSRDQLDLLECNGVALERFVDRYARSQMTAAVSQ